MRNEKWKVYLAEKSGLALGGRGRRNFR